MPGSGETVRFADTAGLGDSADPYNQWMAILSYLGGANKVRAAMVFFSAAHTRFAEKDNHVKNTLLDAIGGENMSNIIIVVTFAAVRNGETYFREIQDGPLSGFKSQGASFFKFDESYRIDGPEINAIRRKLVELGAFPITPQLNREICSGLSIAESTVAKRVINLVSQVCFNGHHLLMTSRGTVPPEYFERHGSSLRVICDVCCVRNLLTDESVPYYGHCSECSFDMCYRCIILTCKLGHSLVSFAAGTSPYPAGSPICDICRSPRINHSPFYHCGACEFDLCQGCVVGINTI
jgi:hypothetical protein